MAADRKRALVTGGAGFIGSHLCERLAAEGREVMVVDNLSSGSARTGVLQAAGAKLVEMDIRDESAGKLIEEFKPGEVYHLAAQIDVRRSVTDPITDADINILGTLRILEGARRVGARVMTTSSGGTIYGEVSPDELPVDERARGRPTSPYGISKKVLEDYLVFFASTYSLAFVNLALGNVFGPRQDPHGEAGVVAIFGSKLLRGEHPVIFGDGRQTRDFVYVGDVVDAFMLASEHGEGETFNIGTGRQTSVTELYWEIASICEVDEAPRFEAPRPGELQNSALDASKAKALLGWKPKTGLREGLSQTIDFLRTQL